MNKRLNGIGERKGKQQIIDFKIFLYFSLFPFHMHSISWIPTKLTSSPSSLVPLHTKHSFVIFIPFENHIRLKSMQKLKKAELQKKKIDLRNLMRLRKKKLTSSNNNNMKIYV